MSLPPIPTFPSQLGEADGSDGAAASPRGSYRPQGRWAECAEHGPIKTLPEADLTCFTPAKSSDLEGEAELEPRNLEELLLEVRGGTPGPHRGHRCVLEPLAGGRTERGSAPRPPSPPPAGGHLPRQRRRGLRKLGAVPGR